MSYVPLAGVWVKLPAMATQKKPTPRTQEHEALGQAIRLVIAEKAGLSQGKVAEHSGIDFRRVNTGASWPASVGSLNSIASSRTRSSQPQSLRPGGG
jgi:hypothetical protein